MGCRWVKSKKNVCARVAQYQKESWAAEKAVRCSPISFDWGNPSDGCISPAVLHNLLTDGFYSPFVVNPHYLLLVDCRDRDSYSKRRLLSAKWHGSLSGSHSETHYISVILYDNIPRTCVPSPTEDSPLAQLFTKLKQQRLEPKVVTGGWQTLNFICKHLMIDGWESPFCGISSLTWFPTLILPGFLYLGQSDMAANPKILKQLRVTHIVTISVVVPRRVLSSTNYLIIPLSEENNNGKIENGGKGDNQNGPKLTTCYGTLIEFISEAKSIGGSVLVHSDEGMASAAAIVMALLMGERGCTLEDAFYYVKDARSAISPNTCLLDQLVALEAMIFGTQITSADDLF